MLFLNVHKYRKDISELYYSPSGPQILFYLIRNPAFFRLTKSIPSFFFKKKFITPISCMKQIKSLICSYKWRY